MKIQRDRPLPKEKKEASSCANKKTKSFKEVLEKTPILVPHVSFVTDIFSSTTSTSPSIEEKTPEQTPGSEILSMPLSSPYLYPCNPLKDPQQIRPLSSVDSIELLEKLGAEMILMHRDGITRTELHITDPSASSLIKNCVITIEEYNSAPKIFNVKIQAPAEVLALLLQHTHELHAVFKERKFGFSINRVDTELLDSGPSFSRKEKVGEEESEDRQGQNN